MASPAFLVFKISPKEAPRTTLQEEMHGEILDLILLFIKTLRHAATRSAPPPRPPAPRSHTDTKTLLFSRHLPMIKYDFVICGFIYDFSPAPFFSYITSAWIRFIVM